MSLRNTIRGLSVAGVAVGLALAITPASAAPPNGGGGGGGACATTRNLSVNNYTIQPGWQINVASLVTNCSSGKQRFTVTRTFTSACGVQYPIASSVLAFKAGESKGLVSPWSLPAGACAGSAVVTETVSSSRGESLAEATSALTVQ